MQHQIYERAKDLMEGQLDDELFALDPSAGKCFGFNGVASRIWRLLALPHTSVEIRNSLLAEYEVSREQCETEVDNLLVDLVERKLVRTVPANFDRLLA